VGESGLRGAEALVRTTKSIAAFLMVFISVLSAQAQGTFYNLNFESANLTPIPAGQYGGDVPISSALPNWSASISGVPVTQVLQNNYTLGAASIDILGPSWNQINPGIIDGNYTVFLQSNPVDSASIFQSGTIQANAESLEFESADILGTGSLTVSFAGNTLSPVLLSSGISPSGQPYDLYGANIAPYANHMGELEFTVPTTSPYYVELDDISFSQTVVPEPSIVALTAIGGLFFGARKWLARQ